MLRRLSAPHVTGKREEVAMGRSVTPLRRRMCARLLSRKAATVPVCSAGWGILPACITANAWCPGIPASRMPSCAHCWGAIQLMPRSCGPSCSIFPCALIPPALRVEPIGARACRLPRQKRQALSRAAGCTSFRKPRVGLRRDPQLMRARV